MTCAPPVVSRRRWLEQTLGSVALCLCGCSSSPSGPSPQPPATPPPSSPPSPPPAGVGNARLTARPQATTTVLAPGAHPLAMGGARDGLLYVPQGYNAAAGVPLILVLHGLGGNVSELNRSDVMPMVPDAANQYGVAFLFPESRASGWDRSNGSFGPDITFLNAALTQTFSRLHVVASRIGVWGFSDGASYSLSMGLCNGDLFSHVAAFSPEYMSPPQPVGQPRVFVSHGQTDPFIPVATSRNGIVPDLRARGYVVDYVEFGGAHTIDPAARARAMEVFLGAP